MENFEVAKEPSLHFTSIAIFLLSNFFNLLMWPLLFRINIHDKKSWGEEFKGKFETSGDTLLVIGFYWSWTLLVIVGHWTATVTFYVMSKQIEI